MCPKGERTSTTGWVDGNRGSSKETTGRGWGTGNKKKRYGCTLNMNVGYPQCLRSLYSHEGDLKF